MVVGGGVGALTVAIRLRVAGHDVCVVERNEHVGGKVTSFERDGYSFDLGPTLLTLPALFDDVFRLAGTSLSEHFDLVRLERQFRHRWPDGSMLDVHDDPDRTAAAFDALAPGAGDQWRAFQSTAASIWEIATRTFLAGPMSGPWALLRRARSPRDVVRIDGLRTLHRSATAHFDDPRLRQWVGRYATYSGSSPFRAPATLACIPHIEATEGCWHPMGGMRRLGAALERVARDVGVEILTGTAVSSIRQSGGRVTGVIAGGVGAAESIAADVVVAGVDAEHLYADLVHDPRSSRRVRRADRSTSAFVLCLAVRGSTPGIGHHNVWFSADHRHEFSQLSSGDVADDPTIYACVSSVTDPGRAPAGCENWTLLVNVPAGAVVDATTHTDLVLDRLAAHGTDLRGRIEFTHALTPADIERRDRSAGGAIYGTSSNSRRAAFLRPPNRGPLDGLFLVGGSSHPGGGLPLVATSAAIVASMVREDTR